MAFTAGSLLHRESLIMAELYKQVQDWPAVRPLAVEQNRLQLRTRSAAARYFREVRNRLQTLTENQFELLLTGTVDEQKQILWLAICKRYRFIADFAAEVMREKFVRHDTKLHHEDYHLFFNRKIDWHPELEEITESTYKKLRQIVFRTMREADFLSGDDHLKPANVTQTLSNSIWADDPRWFYVFPLTDYAIESRRPS